MTDQPSSETQAATPDQIRRSATLSTLGSHVPAVGDRYRIESVLAKGGMGEVYRAHDLALNRDVAIKVLLGEPKNFDLANRRFLHEASIGAQLQHPNIPPVYDIGSYADGRPFLAMKLVKGRTLNELLKERAGLAVDRGRFVAIFEAIAQAVGYAHSRGVIHRDLKPSNVMVGAFGEVQVMDWGLAKFQSDATELTPPESVASTFHDPRAADDSKTGAGSILGTPAYMPPEQAIGAVDKITERSDVFGLGALLCAVLTGQPPYVGADAESTRQLAAQGKLADAFARLDASGAEPELIALAKRCLNPDAAERPANGSEVAAAVARFRTESEDRARRAEIARAASEARRRALAWGAAAVALVLGAGIVGTVIGLRRAEAEAERNAKLSYGIREASKVAGIEGNVEKRRVAAAELQALLKLDPADVKDPQQRRLRCAAEIQRGDLLIHDNPPAALAAFERAANVARGLVQEFPDNVVYRRDLIGGLYGAARVLIDLRRPADAEAALTDAERQAAENFAKFPDDMDVQRHRYIISNQLGETRLLQGDLKAAKEKFEAGLKLTEAVAQQNPKLTGFVHDASVCYNRIAAVLREQALYPEALLRSGKAVELREFVVGREPRNVKYKQDLLTGYRDHADILKLTGDLTSARAVILKAIRLNEEIVPLASMSAADLSLYALWYERLGLIAVAQNAAPDVARTHFEKALEIFRRANQLDPETVLYARNIAVMNNHLGRISLQANDPERALAYFRSSLPIADGIAKAHPDDLQYQKDFAQIHYFIGEALKDLNKVAEARSHFQTARLLFQVVAKKAPDSITAQSDYFNILHSSGKLEFLSVGDLDAAVTFFESALNVLTPFEKVITPANEPQLATNLEECRALLRESKDVRMTIQDLKLLRAQPKEKIPSLLVMRGVYYAIRSDVATATATADALTAFGPTDAVNWYNAACILGVACRHATADPPADRAVALLRKAVELGFRDRQKILGDEDLAALRERPDFQSLIASLAPPKLKELAPPPRERLPLTAPESAP